MEIKDIRQFSEISAVRRNPGVLEHGKFLKWNNNSSKFDYKFIGSGDIDIDYFTDFVENIYDEKSANLDDYLVSITKLPNNYARFTMSLSPYKDLQLGALAWEDAITLNDIDLNLPGNQKVLFDENGAIGGRTAVKYNYISNYLNLQGTSLNFDITNGGEGSYKEGIKYLGNYSFSFGQGAISSASGTRNIISGYHSGRGLKASSRDNSLYGSYTGEFCADNLTNSIFLGTYAGRYENGSYKLFIDSIDYLTEVDAQEGSFLYADLLTERRLHVRDRLAVVKEGKFGDSGISDGDGEEGMFQMLAVSPGVVKPQWYSNGIWNDFETSVDVYLSDVTYGTGALTFTMSDATVIGPVDISDVVADIELPFATSPSSPANGQTATSDYGYLQISNSSFTDNEGFTHKSGLLWDNTNTELNIPGAIKMASKAVYNASNGIIRYDSTLGHFYGRIADTWKQLDNTDFEEITAVNIGGAAYEWFKQKNSDGELELRTIQAMEIDTNFNPYDRITFKYSSTGDAVLVGTTAERNRLSTTIDDESIDRMVDKANIGETLHIRALREGTNMVLTQTENYIRFDAVVGGAAALMTGSNLGTYDIFKQVNGIDFEFYGLHPEDDRVKMSQEATDINIWLDITPAAANIAPSKVYTGGAESVNGDWLTPDGITPTIQFKKIVSDTITITSNATEVILELPESPAVVSCANVGGEEEIFVSGSSAPFNFRTLKAVTNSHITVVENGNNIDFSVEDLTYTYNGTGEELLVGTTGFEIVSKGIKAATDSGLTVTTVTDAPDVDIVIDQTKPIPKFSFITTPDFTENVPVFVNENGVNGTLSFTVDYKADIRADETLVTDTMFNLNIGTGLSYDPVNNTLRATGTPPVDSIPDLALRNIIDNSTVTDYILDFYVEDALGNGAFNSPINVTLPKFILPIATSGGPIGGVYITETTNVHEIDGPTGTVGLEFDEFTGEVKYTQDVVTYTVQNNLHDDENTEVTDINLFRANARANIGSAYINGATDEDFNVDTLTATTKIYCDTESIKEDDADVSRIQDILFSSQYLTSTVSDIYLAKRGDPYEEFTSVGVLNGDINILVNGNAGNGRINICKSNAGLAGGGVTKMFEFDTNTGDLYVKGSIKMGGTFQAFSSVAQNM